MDPAVWTLRAKNIYLFPILGMRRFLTHSALFCVPFITVFAFPFLVLLKAGEFIPVSVLTERSTASSTLLIGPAYSYFRNEFQLKETRERTPKILALGNSRVGEFRDLFFKNPSEFYNASGAVGQLSDYRHFIEKLEVPPEVLLINIDQAVFNGALSSSTVSRPDPFNDASSGTFDPFFESFFRQQAWWKVYRDYLNHKFSLKEIFSKPDTAYTIGIRALSTHNGFLRDGSDYYGDVISGKTSRKSIDEGIAALASQTTNSYSDTYSANFSPEAFKELEMLLALCKGKNITVVGFAPPLAHAVYEKLSSYPDAPYAESFEVFAPTMTILFKGYGYEFYDFTDLESFRSSDAEMVEAKHGGEKMHARMILEMSRGGTALSSYVAEDQVRTGLQNTTSPYSIFGVTE